MSCQECRGYGLLRPCPCCAKDAVSDDDQDTEQDDDVCAFSEGGCDDGDDKNTPAV